MRMKLTKNTGTGRSGDIPLINNKCLPWLVKVPYNGSDYISFWVRVVREDITSVWVDDYQPQQLLITFWPIYVIKSMLTVPLSGTESVSLQKFTVNSEGGRHTLSLPVTYESECDINFNFRFPLSSDSESRYKLTLKHLKWNKFFWYDEKEWNIEKMLRELGKATAYKWPLDDEQELRISRGLAGNPTKMSINYSIQPTRPFSCAMALAVSPWGMLINGSATDIRFNNIDDDAEVFIKSNELEMISTVETAFTLSVPYGSGWVQSLPIYFPGKVNTASIQGRYYVLADTTTTNAPPIKIVIQRNVEIFQFILEFIVDDDRNILKLYPKYVVTNFTKRHICLFPFALDQKEKVLIDEIHALNVKVGKLQANPVESEEYCFGYGLDFFTDLKATAALHSADTAFVYFLCLKLCDNSDLSIPIPLEMPFTRRCLSIQYGHGSIPIVCTLIERKGIFYLNIFNDVSPAILLYNQTDIRLVVSQTTASENSLVTNTTLEYDGRHFEWYQTIPPNSKCYYTPPEQYKTFPDIDMTMSNITLATSCVMPKKCDLKWSKPIRTDKQCEKFLHIPNHGDVKVVICNKHKITRVYIYYISQQMEFSVKDLRLRLLKPTTANTSEKTEHKYHDLSLVTQSEESFDNTVFDNVFRHPIKCKHFLNDCDSDTQWKIKIYIKEVVVSLHKDSPEKDCMKCEIFAMYMDDFMLAYDHTDDQRKMNIIISNMQIDNQLYASEKYDFPVILCSENIYAYNPDNLPKVYELNRVYDELRNRSPMALITIKYYDDEFKIDSLHCAISPLRAYIEDAYLNDLFDVLVEWSPANCVHIHKTEQPRLLLERGEFLVPAEVVSQALCIAEPLKINSFRIEPLSVLLSVHTSLRMYIALDHSPLSFSAYERQQILTVPLRFGQSLGMHYLSGAIFGAGWVVGSLEILGSPSGLARSFTTGLIDFVSMPVQGLFRGPWGFIVGITQGSASLLRNVTAGTVNSVTKLAASVARNLDRLTLDQEHIERTEALRRSRPQGFTEGFTQGITGLGISILGAVGGIARHTLEARSPVEVVTGMGKGLMGAFTKPISGAAELVALTGQGVLVSVGFNALPHQRKPSVCHNMAINPSGYRVWQMLPNVLRSDQLLFYHQITTIVDDQLTQCYAVLTSAIFAIADTQKDQLHLVLPIEKVELECDRDDKTLIYVRLKRDGDEIEESQSYTNARILSFLDSHSSIKTVQQLTPDSFEDLLQEHAENRDGARIRNDTSFHIKEYLGEQLIKYLKVITKKNL